MADQEITDLYREVILDHFKEPHHQRLKPGRTCPRRATTPFAGTPSRCRPASRTGASNRYPAAAGDAPSARRPVPHDDMVKGKELKEALGLIEQLQQMMQGQDIPGWDGDIEALKGARKFPGRVKCVTLAWHTLGAGDRKLRPKRKERRLNMVTEAQVREALKKVVDPETPSGHRQPGAGR